MRSISIITAAITRIPSIRRLAAAAAAELLLIQCTGSIISDLLHQNMQKLATDPSKSTIEQNIVLNAAFSMKIYDVP